MAKKEKPQETKWIFLISLQNNAKLIIRNQIAGVDYVGTEMKQLII